MKPFLKGVKQVEAGLTDVGSSLEDLARDAAKSSSKMGDSIEDGTKDGTTAAERYVDELSNSFNVLSKEVKRETKSAGDAVAKNMKDGTDGAKAGVQEVGEEAAGTARETAASFDGSADSIVGAFQEVAANAFAGFGPAGMAAGLLVAGGIGLAVKAFQDGQEDAEAFRARVGEITTELLALESTGGPPLEFVSEKLKELTLQSEKGETSLKDLRDIADKSGSSYKDLAQAYSGNTDELRRMVSAGGDLYDSLIEQAGAIDTTTTAGVKQFSELNKRADAQNTYNHYLIDARDAALEAKDAEANYAAAGGPELEAKAQIIATIDAAYDDAAGAVEDYVDEESGIFDVAGYVAAMEARSKALEEYQETLQTSGLDAQAKAFLDSQGVEAAATFLAGYKSATPEQQAALRRIWSEAGRASSGTYSEKLKAGIPSTIPGPLVEPRVATANAETALRTFLQRSRTVDVTLTAYTRTGQRVI